MKMVNLFDPTAATRAVIASLHIEGLTGPVIDLAANSVFSAGGNRVPIFSCLAR
jgi:hypothetical protein